MSGGWLAQFADARALVEAARALTAEGYRKVEAYSPCVVDGLADALGRPPNRVPAAMLAGAIVGGGGIFALELYSATVSYPVLIGGRPLASIPAFVPPALEMTLLGAAVFGVVALLLGARLPKLHHPVFDIERFEAASRDGFFIVVDADDERFERDATRARLDALGATFLAEMPS